MKNKTFLIKTFGCKVNQCESAFITEELIRYGYRPAQSEETVDVCIVHGCAVTSRASYEARQALYQFHRRYPHATAYIFAGCCAHYEGEVIAGRQLATHVLGNVEKLNLPNFLKTQASLQHPLVALSDPRGYDYRPVTMPGYECMVGRSRAFLKIQDGCDSFCSYCIVPYTRGPRRSLDPDVVAFQIKRMVLAGYNEIVLAGIHLGQWGQDFSPSKTVLDLLRFLEGTKSLPPKLRLSSLEPSECTPELINFLRDREWFCPHFHVPLQSGDPGILRLMGRNYTPGFYAEVIESIRSAFPGASIGADVIVGFPGETEKSFENTFKLVERLPLTYLHVFPFSPRKGTPASDFSESMVRSEVRYLARKLRELGNAKRRIFMLSQVMKEFTVVLEAGLQEGLWRATSENYLPVLVQTNGRPVVRGAIARVLVTDYDSGRDILIARLV